MSSAFRASWAAHRGDLMEHFADAKGFRIEPRVVPRTANGRPDVNAAPQADPDNPPVTVAGVFIASASLDHAKGRAMADSTTHAIAAGHFILYVAVAEIAGRPDQGWIVTRLETGARFSVTHCLAVDFGRYALHLAELR